MHPNQKHQFNQDYFIFLLNDYLNQILKASFDSLSLFKSESTLDSKFAYDSGFFLCQGLVEMRFMKSLTIILQFAEFLNYISILVFNKHF